MFSLFSIQNFPENIENISSKNLESMLKRAHPDLIETNLILNSLIQYCKRI